MNAEDPAVQGWQDAIEQDEARLSTSARARRGSAELFEVQRRLSQALSACSELGMAYAAALLAANRLERENARLRTAAEWAVARDCDKTCERCEQTIRRGEAYEFQPGTGGLTVHIHCPDKEATDA